MNYIDLHTHGIAGYDTRSHKPEDYIRMAEAFKAHGTGAFVPTLFPASIEEMRAVMAAIKRAMEMQGKGKEARLLGVHLEGPFVNPMKQGALGGEHFMKPEMDTFARLVEGFEDIVKIITVAPELPGALGIIEKAVSLGIRVNMGHSAATFAQASDGRKAGATGVTHLFNAMSPLHHREPGLAGYALMDDGLYVEVIADMHHLHPETLRIVLKCKPKDRIILVSDSLGTAKTEGQPEKGPVYLPDGKTLAGSGISLPDAVENMASLGMASRDAEASASDNPNRYLYG